MIEIKFRAWDKKRKVMFKVRAIDMDDSGRCGQRIEDGEPLRFIDRKDVELMQYTGLKDSHGIEIYEGDVVKIIDENYTSLIMWEHGAWCIYHPYRKHFDINCGFTEEREHIGFGYWTKKALKNTEVIGNIYENPELKEA